MTQLDTETNSLVSSAQCPAFCSTCRSDRKARPGNKARTHDGCTVTDDFDFQSDV